MAGVPNAVLSGWKVPVVYWPVADHTYVTSNCGLVWGCYGNQTGGTPVSSASGSSAIADCIAEPNGMAGIRWNRNGWCHQIANRILHPAGITVAGARGYAYSRFKFGVYGRNVPPPSLSPCYQGVGKISQLARPMSDADMASFVPTPRRMHDLITEAAHMAEFHGPDRIGELADLVRSTPGLTITDGQFHALAEAQGRLWEAEDELGVMLDNDQISPDDFMRVSENRTRSCMKECADILGMEKFHLLFGEAGFSPEGMMDRDRFLADHNRYNPRLSTDEDLPQND